MKTSLSVVIAVYNGANFLKKSLPALQPAADAETEIILVDDGSTDNSAGIGEKYGAKIIKLAEKRGAANARNAGVRQARGEIILFIDADVVVQFDTIKNARQVFADNPEISAFFGSYDDAPGELDFFSQYRNLMHHFYHQTSQREAETFWSGFGAIKRQVFLDMDGFDASKFETPSIEDIELGYRLRKKGYRILLVPELQVTHLKKWTFYSILKTDFWYRAVPWSEIMLLSPQVEPDLNVKSSQKISALLTGILLFSLCASLWHWWFLIIALGCLIGLITINRDFYNFFRKCRGFRFTLLVLPMHLLYFLYSSAAFVYSWFNVKLLGRTIIVR